MKPLVSILIPAFNAERWIGDTINSALRQTWKRREIIVVNDGSTDGTLSAARRFASEGVCVVSQANQGAAAARNKALSLCQGDYIQWLDADDLLGEEKIAKQIQALASCPTKRTLLSSAWGSFIYRPSRANFVPTSLWRDLSPVEWLLRKMNENLYMQPGTWLASRELTEAAGPWDTRLLGDDDGEYFCRVLLASEGTQFIPEAKVFYRKAVGNSLSYIGESERKLKAQLLSMELHVKYLRSLEESARVRDACLKYLETWLSFLCPENPDVIDKVQNLAAGLGGRLQPPRLPWKYSWIEKLLGRTVARRVQLRYNVCKAFLIRSWDKAFSLLESR